jgi:hypothetical protein
MNTNEQENMGEATEAEARKTFEYMERPEVKEMWKRWDEESERIRKIYVDNPDRKTTFDVVEIFWYEFLERYSKALNDEQMRDVIDRFIENYQWHELVYIVAEGYAKEMGWEEKY